MPKSGAHIKESNPKWLAKLKDRYRKKEYRVAVGIPKGTDSVGISYPDGTSVLSVAFYNEFGTETIPSRPAIKIGGRNASKELGPVIKKIVKETNDDKRLVDGLNVVGLAAVAIVQEAILRLRVPPNAPFTVSQKGSDNPLIDTGLYRQSIRHQVREE